MVFDGAQMVLWYLMVPSDGFMVFDGAQMVLWYLMVSRWFYGI